jgi:hypothetical protein
MTQPVCWRDRCSGSSWSIKSTRSRGCGARAWLQVPGALTIEELIGGEALLTHLSVVAPNGTPGRSRSRAERYRSGLAGASAGGTRRRPGSCRSPQAQPRPGPL